MVQLIDLIDLWPSLFCSYKLKKKTLKEFATSLAMDNHIWLQNQARLLFCAGENYLFHWLYFGVLLLPTWEMFLCISPGKVNAPSSQTYWLENWRGREQTMPLKSFHRFWCIIWEPLVSIIGHTWPTARICKWKLLETSHFPCIIYLIYNWSTLQRQII